MHAHYIEPTEKMYNDYIDDMSEGDINIMGICFRPSDILREMDSTAYDTGYSEYCDEYGEWECDECGERYETEEEAEECCQEENQDEFDQRRLCE